MLYYVVVRSVALFRCLVVVLWLLGRWLCSCRSSSEWMAGVYLPAFLLGRLYCTTIRLREWNTDFKMILDQLFPRGERPKLYLQVSQYKKRLMYRSKHQPVHTHNLTYSQWVKINESCEKLNKFNGNCYHTDHILLICKSDQLDIFYSVSFFVLHCAITTATTTLPLAYVCGCQSLPNSRPSFTTSFSLSAHSFIPCAVFYHHTSSRRPFSTRTPKDFIMSPGR